MQFILITPESEDTQSYFERLSQIVSGGAVAAVIIARGDRDDDAMERHAKSLLPIIQDNGAAALLEDLPSAVPKIEADGACLTAGARGVKEATAKLQPNFIVGAADLRSRHEAMLRGEAGVDFVLFGAPDRSPMEEDFELAGWWVETMQIDSAIVADIDQIEKVRQAGAEFMALPASAWETDEQIAKLASLITQEAAS